MFPLNLEEREKKLTEFYVDKLQRWQEERVVNWDDEKQRAAVKALSQCLRQMKGILEKRETFVGVDPDKVVLYTQQYEGLDRRFQKLIEAEGIEEPQYWWEQYAKTTEPYL